LIDAEVLSHESHISRRQLVLDEVQCPELDVQILKPNLIELDQTWNDVASDVPLQKILTWDPTLKSPHPRSTASGLTAKERRKGATD
jgi:hypothetical protein